MFGKYRSIIILLLIFIFLIVIIPFIFIYGYNEPDTFDGAHPKKYGIVFGASIRKGGALSPTLKNRVDDAINLYKEHKIVKIVFSGSAYKQLPPGEPRAMKKYALTKGIKAEDIILDERGDRTYLTVEFTKLLSKLHPHSSFVFISSGYHIPRIRFLVSMMEIPNSSFYFTPKYIPFYRKEILREAIAFWFYVSYKIIYKWR